MLVPAGTSLCDASELQEAPEPPSKTRERNVPEAAYGDRRSQSTDTDAAPTFASLATSFRELVIVLAWVATRVPST